MTGRIAELRALVAAEEQAYRTHKLEPSRGTWVAHQDAEYALQQEAVEYLPTLLDCAEALKAVLGILPVCPKNTGLVGIEARYKTAVVGAREALARLNGEPDAKP